MSSVTVGVKIRKGNFLIDNQCTNSAQHIGTSEVSLQRVGKLPYLLCPSITELVGLSLERYQLDVKAILSLAVIQQHEGGTKYILPLQNGVTISHPNELFRTETFSSCVLDQRTVVTFDDSQISQTSTRPPIAAPLNNWMVPDLSTPSRNN